MPLGNEIGQFLWKIGEQTDGFTFGKPWRASNRSLGLVIPILREKELKRRYKMMEEAKGKIDIEDTGDVDRMRVISNAEMNVFIRSGVILSGKGQTRATVSGMIIMPNSKQEIEVKCVYASKPTHRGAKMVAEDIAPPIVMQSLYGSQRDTWNTVTRYTSGMKGHLDEFLSVEEVKDRGVLGAKQRMGRVGRSLGSDDLLGTMREVERSQKTVEGVIKNIPLQKNQVGAIIFDIDSIVGFEVFDSPKSWKAMHKKVISKYNEVLQKEQEKMLFELKPDVIPEKIAEFIEELTKSDERTTHSNEVSKTVVIDGERHIGEYTTIGADAIHVIAFKRERPKTKNNPVRQRERQRNTESKIVSTLEKNVNVEREPAILADILRNNRFYSLR